MTRRKIISKLLYIMQIEDGASLWGLLYVFQQF